MSTNESAKTEASQEGLSFANALRDFIVCGVILIDGREKIISFSDEARQILGLSVAPKDQVSLDVLPSVLQSFVREGLSTGFPVAGRQMDLAVEGRELVTVRVSALPLAAKGAGPGMAVVVNDLTAARRLEQNLWHYDRLVNIGTLSASMAHEIKNALVAGKTFVDLLLEKHQDAELADVVRREMGRIDAIVSRMLRFVSPAQPKFTEVSLHEVLEHSLCLVQSQLAGKLITLERSFRAMPDQVKGDDRQLQQVFVNLFLNASEAMGPNGTLKVATEVICCGTSPARRKDSPSQAQVGVTIRDSGAGIPPENLAHLFEPFFTTKPTGTGLGLAITRRIIEEHRGQISVKSEPDQGTTFRVIFPALGTPS
jgi:two-component system, NtrC family, sensor histidine kinase HydH